jgi:transcriptional regulator with XRE-family HTH domain
VRYSVGKSQTRLAADAGLSRGQVWRIETGRSAPSDSARIRIAAALNTTPADLFTYDEAAA